ncbi:MAG TPA: hypothetical protein VNJ54_20750 [Plantibacter sp.]|uniref:hypothetical protein n=1 Tax=Plantibacter sp. TaxID=1871045 RepID=UPI002CA0F333|nr:hypothetical protein [Plantibacter sp.]
MLFVIVVAAGTFGFVSQSTADSSAESASGHGTLLAVDENGKTVKRQFTFHARKSADGTVTGKVVLRNPAFDGDDGKSFFLKGDISCLQVVGNVAFLGGTPERTNDANLNDAFFFNVQDNGEPGKDGDRISRVFFFDDDPTTQGDPQLCRALQPFPLERIESGNIQVRGLLPTP